MRKLWLGGMLALFGLCIVPSPASALSCPNASYPQFDPTTDNIYTVIGTNDTTVVDCVTEYGNGNLNGSTNPNGNGTDDFLDGPDDDITTSDQYFQPGGDWTSYCSTTGNTSAGACGTAYGFSWTGGGGSSGSWSFTGVAGSEYALGVKDGSDPYWAVFLLSSTSTSYSGSWSIVNGGLSHFAIYDRTAATPGVQPETPVPEPASLLLLGSGLAMAGRHFRRRRRQAQNA